MADPKDKVTCGVVQKQRGSDSVVLTGGGERYYAYFFGYEREDNKAHCKVAGGDPER